MIENVTLCLTIGKRPLQLESTLISLFEKIKFEKIIAINDFRDKETNDVFKRLCPTGHLISLDQQIGHHKAIDYMYSLVETEYIFHCEDDWLFDKELDINSYISFLKNNQFVTSLCLRKIEDFNFSISEFDKIKYSEFQGLGLALFDNVHDQWYGYSFNPHIAHISNWKNKKGFSNFKKERHISRQFRKENKHVYFLKSGVCYHSGHEISVANPKKKTFFSKLKSNFLTNIN